MHTVNVGLGDRSYDIEIGASLEKTGERLTGLGFGRKMALVTNHTVKKLYGQRVVDSLKAAGFMVMSIEIPDGEQYKNLDWANAIYTALLTNFFDRTCALVALGGGVIGDLTGFAAATFMRGVPFAQVPTTLLAMVDSSVGGKTGVNHPMGKNMIGAFHQPRAVVADTATLETLPAREFHAGLTEVIKYGLIRDLPFFDWLEAHLDAVLARAPDALAYGSDGTSVNLHALEDLLREVAAVAGRHGATLIVDEAHAIGVMGAGGGGLCREGGCKVRPDFVVGTLSKSLGGYGGFVGCSSARRWMRTMSNRSAG